MPLEKWWEKPCLTVDEATKVLPLSRSGIYEACRRNELPHLRFGSRVVILTAPLMKLLELPETEEGASQAPSPTPSAVGPYPLSNVKGQRHDTA